MFTMVDIEIVLIYLSRQQYFATPPSSLRRKKYAGERGSNWRITTKILYRQTVERPAPYTN